MEILRLGHRVSQTNLGHVSQNTRLCSETLKMVLGRMKWKNHSAGTCYEPGCAVPPPTPEGHKQGRAMGSGSCSSRPSSSVGGLGPGDLPQRGTVSG